MAGTLEVLAGAVDEHRDAAEVLQGQPNVAAAGSSPRSENQTPGMPLKMSDNRDGCACVICS